MEMYRGPTDQFPPMGVVCNGFDILWVERPDSPRNQEEKYGGWANGEDTLLEEQSEVKCCWTRDDGSERVIRGGGAATRHDGVRREA